MRADLRDHLLTLELALADRDVSLAPCDLIDLIAPDFLDLAELAADVVLATYRLDGMNRSSIWVRRDGRWQIRFHQGTTAAAIPSVGPDERFSE